jgi:tetratricopeptide (TPR) repeat protein
MQPELGPREASEALMTELLRRFPASEDPQASSRLHFRLGQLRLAMALENAQKKYAIGAETLVIAEFREAARLDPSNGIIAPWEDTMEMALPAIFEDWVKAVPLAERGFQNVAKNPLGNTLSLSGTTIGFPLSTGIPQRTAKLLDDWRCEGVDFCSRNTAHAPYARPGLSYHFAEAYARVGQRDKAQRYLREALSSPGAEHWPYRAVAQSAYDQLDGFLKTFADLGQDGSAFHMVYANQPSGCLFCHQK